MGIFGRIKDIVSAEVNYAVKQTVDTINNPEKIFGNKGMQKEFDAPDSNSGGFQTDYIKGTKRVEKFTFFALPMTVSELKDLPEASLDTPFKAAALTMATLCNFERDEEATYEMLDFLKGPIPLNPAEKASIKDKLKGKSYKAFSFFEGAVLDNNYRPYTPFTIGIVETENSFKEENRAVLYVASSGATGLRPLKLRKKTSTGQWFLTDIECLGDIREPNQDDPWA